MLKNFAQNVFKWYCFDQVYSRFTRDGKMAFFTSQARPLRRETSQRRQPEVFLAVISLPLVVTDVCRRRILSRLCLVPRPRYYARPTRFGSRGPRKFLRPRQTRRSETVCLTWGGAFGSGRAVNNPSSETQGQLVGSIKCS